MRRRITNALVGLLVVGHFAEGGARAAVDQPKPQPTQLLLGDVFAMEAYFSWDGKKIVFQGKTNKDGPLQVFVCDYRLGQAEPLQPVEMTRGSSNHECTFFSKDGHYLVYATTPEGTPNQDGVDFGGYPYFYDLSKEIWVARLEGDHLGKPRRITRNQAYEAESSFSPPIKNLPGRPDGIYVLYTSSRSGNLDLWMQRVFDGDGKEVLDEAIQLTQTETLQEGGSFFLSDREIVYREWTFDPKDPKTEQMQKGRVNYRPMQIHRLDLTTGTDTIMTHGNARHWAPFPHPTGQKAVFAKRDFSKENPGFDIYVLDLQNGHQQQITAMPGFEGYPVFHPSGDLIMFSRFDPKTHNFSLWTVPYRPE